MSTGSGGKPPSGSQPGRPAADTPQRLVVRSIESNAGSSSDSMMGAHDTAVAFAQNKHTPHTISNAETPAAGTPSLSSSTSSSGSTAGSSMAEIVGATLSGRYLVTRKVGQGGMGAVYEATHTLIGKRVAVKVLLEKYAQREAIVARLKQEAQLASSIGNEHIIDITDFGTTEDGRTFVVMEFLEGESLAECLAREPQLPEQRLLRIIQQTTSALAAAHAKGIVHRDIKPENLFLLRRKDQDFVKVVDFGISKSIRVSTEEDQPRLTQTGMVLGTPLYMSPEQARGDDELDHRVDIYALGVIMYEAATGRVPFAGNNYLSVISQVLNESPKPPRELRPDLSEEFEAIVMKAMEKDRNERYENALDMLADVSAVIDDPTRSTERAKITGPRKKIAKKTSFTKYPVWIGAVALVVIAIGVLVNLLMGDSPKQRAAAGEQLDAGVALATDALVVAPVPPDAGVTEQIKTLEVTIESEPKGAEVSIEGAVKGKTPLKVPIVLKDKEVEGVISLAGYDDRGIKFNPWEIQKKPVLLYKLKKPKAGAPTFRLPRTGSGAAGGTTEPTNKNPDFGGYPGAGSGNVPSPK
ncbi:MAG: serine/threonine protein kinase [Deltaproteobacteria bacterium]|nr:serine/threonine protein kinase [Deltaproteobacteria bacterium]